MNYLGSIPNPAASSLLLTTKVSKYNSLFLTAVLFICFAFFNLLISAGFSVKPFVVEARHPSRTESAKIRNRRMLKKVYPPPSTIYVVYRDALYVLIDACKSLDQFNGTPRKPRLSVFCSEKQLYAMLVDDQNKRCLFYGSTLQKPILGDPPCTKIVSPLIVRFDENSSLG